MSYMPEIRFPTALIDWQDQFQTIRERCMLAFINSITDKPDWHEKVFDDAIVAKWRQEASTAKWEALGIENGDFTDSMFDYVSSITFDFLGSARVAYSVDTVSG